MRPRPLSDAEQRIIEQFGLFNLRDFFGSKPNEDAVAAIKAMFEASVAGEPYDMAAFGKYYRPYGVGGSATSQPITRRAAPKPAKKPSPQDLHILAKLWAKTEKAKEGRVPPSRPA